MRAYLIFLFFSLFVNVAIGQTIGKVDNEDYEVINQITNSLIEGRKQLYVKDNDTAVALYEKSLVFKDQKRFFTKKAFEEYFYTPIDSVKIKKLIKSMNFEYLANQKREEVNWNLSKFKYPFIRHSESTPYETIRFSVSPPIYSKDKKVVFIFFSSPCNYDGCGATTVKVYKKVHNKWVWYLNFPITLS
ncbi:hypothetical protein [Flavobacterium sp. WG21]|uniref:hypothetical protein n=1 Tax=Flavobacterium sp. WG21 TaxID=1229487 RepID=UPI0003449B6E|nr:hypothetical protein [Flavobacterium sp. WG21]